MINTLFLVKMVFKEILFPPGSLILLLVAGILFLKRKPRLGKGLIIFATFLFYALSTPLVGKFLLRTLETSHFPQENISDVGAIVVLGAGLNVQKPEYGGVRLSAPSMERLLCAAQLYKRTGLPVFLSGGKTNREGVSESEMMKKSLEEDFHVPVTWMEGESLNTFSNAKNSAELLKQRGIKKVYLVTHAFHMPRARKLFERFGLEIVPVPAIFYGHSKFYFEDLFPVGMLATQAALNEWVGLLLMGMRPK